MALYYLKKLQHQEMGSPDFQGKIHRGRYIYLSKDSGFFFPHLSQTVLNDTIVLPVIMPFSNSKIYAQFVYHNSKFFPGLSSGTPRDEFRLYLNNELDQYKTYFHENEIAVIEKVETTVSNNDNRGYVYSINLFSPSDSPYSFLEQIIMDSPMRGNNAIFEGNLDFVLRPVITEDTSASISEDVINIVKKEQTELIQNIEEDSIEEKNVENVRGANLFNNISFRDFVLFAYGYKCAITGVSIRYKNLNNLEAAHIQPKAQAGTYLPCNGLALCRDMHWAFDKGFITIADDYTVLVHDEVKDSILLGLNGKKINIPTDSYFQPEKKFLKYHRENIFGLFIHSGSIRSNP